MEKRASEKAYSYLHEEMHRIVREQYRKTGYRGSWQQFYKDYEERVKADALRLREENEGSKTQHTQVTREPI